MCTWIFNGISIRQVYTFVQHNEPNSRENHKLHIPWILILISRWNGNGTVEAALNCVPVKFWTNMPDFVVYSSWKMILVGCENWQFIQIEWFVFMLSLMSFGVPTGRNGVRQSSLHTKWISKIRHFTMSHEKPLFNHGKWITISVSMGPGITAVHQRTEPTFI